ncbi:MAG: hypothetical protein KDH96_02505 [Candidatus Riesia sp.]|nr:hypothetical protein [Candidatus Riesia sp.]
MNGVQQQGMPKFITGDKVMMFAPSTKVKSMRGAFDKQTISQWYSEDPERRHLGLMEFFGQMSTTTYGVMPDLLKHRQVLEVGADGKFTYDVPVYEEKECMTTRDNSDQVYPGKDETTFKITLSEAFEPGDVLTYDPLYGDDIMVTEETVKNTGDGYEHIVKYVGNDKDEWFPASQLADGITYYKINHAIFGEYGTNYSTFQMPDTSSYFRCEFELGSDRGVEAFITAKADKSFSGAAASKDTLKYFTKIQQELEKYGDMAMLFDYDAKSGKVDPKSMKLATTVEILVRKELEKLTASALMFQKAGRITGSNGAAMFNEGLWHQLRRGKLIKYARPQGLTRSHIKEAVEYVFRENPLPVHERIIIFKCGSEMFHNFNEIFKDEVNAQLDRLSNVTNLFGTDGQIPKSPIEGTDLMSLKLNPVAFREVFLPGIGTVVPVHDFALDYMSEADRFSQGFHPYKKSHTTYSAVIWDARDQSYSNNKKLPKGVSLVEGGNNEGNIFLVKPEGELTISGYTNGRYNPYKSSEILSSVKQRGNEFWAWNSCAIWLADPSVFVMIELDPAGRKGYI